MTGSPRLAVRLLQWRLPASEHDEIIGDLEEQFAQLRSDRGLTWARRWYWRQAMALASGLQDTPSVTERTRSRVMSMDDLRYAVRRFIKQPGATMASVLTLAFAIGASVAAWSLLSAVLVHPLPVEAAHQLVTIGMYQKKDNTGPLSNDLSYQLYPAVRDSGVFQSLAAGGSWDLLVASGGLAESHPVYFASHSFFDTLGVGMRMGRPFGREDDQQGAPLVAILSDRYWRRAFNADPDAIGRTLTVTNKPVTIIGVTPAGFRGTSLTEAPDLYLPFHTVIDVGNSSTNYFDDGTRQESPTWWVRLFARLQPGMTAAEATRRLAPVKAGERAYGEHLGLTDLNTAALPATLRAGMARFGKLLGITVGLLLLIGCLTVGMLLLLRTEARRDEFALCLALGAARTRLAAGIALDGVLLAAAGAAAALPVAMWLFTGVRAFQLPGGVSIDLLDLHLDNTALVAALASAAVATMVMAMLAGVFGLTANTTAALRARAGATPRIGRRRTRASLVVAQVAISLVLLIGAGLFLRSLASALSLNPGFDTTRTASASLSLGGYGYTPESAATFMADLRVRLSQHPALQSLSISSYQGGMTSSGKVILDGQRTAVPSFVAYTGIDQDYFATMGMAILNGRNISADDRTGSPRVAIVSASFAKLIRKDGEALGHHVTESSNRIGQPPDVLEVVGIVPDVVTNVADLSPMVLYMPIAQLSAPRSATVVLHARTDASAAVNAAVSIIKGMDPAVPPLIFTTMEQRISRQMGPQKLGAVVLGGLGTIAALLTLFGTYVLVESMSVLRRREMGVRAALGATRGQLGGLVMAETLRLIGFGLAAGLLLAWAGAGTIRSFLFCVQPFDAVTIGGVLTVILVLALVVSLRPAVRASRVDLATVLREE